MELVAVVEDDINELNQEWKHGKVFFERTQCEAKYLIVPPGVKDPLQVLAVSMMLWELDLPRMYVEIEGGHTPQENWYESVVHMEKWDDKNQLNAAVDNILHAVAEACTECQAWVFGLVDDCTFYGPQVFGAQRRSSRQASRLPLWVDFLAFEPEIWMYDAFVQASQAISTSTAQPRSKRVRYPHRKDMIAKTIKGEYKPQENNHFPDMMGECTHMLLGSGVQTDRIRGTFSVRGLGSLVPRVELVMEGRPMNVHKIVEDAKHFPVILLRHTGGAADILSEAVLLRRQTLSMGMSIEDEKRIEYTIPPHYKQDYQEDKFLFKLPERVNVENFIILDAKGNHPETVVEKIIQCVSKAGDEEMNQLGYKTTEANLLLKAWHHWWVFEKAASQQACVAAVLHYFILFISMITTAMSVFYSLAKPELLSDHDTVELSGLNLALTPTLVKNFGYATAILPLVSAFLISCNTKFFPVSRWAQFKVAAVHLLSEIYMYRARVSDYGKDSTMKFDPTSVVGTNPSLQALAQTYKARLKLRGPSLHSPGSAGENPTSSETSSKPRPYVDINRRTIFATRVDDIVSLVLRGDAKEMSLPSAPDDLFRTLIAPTLCGASGQTPPTDTAALEHQFMLLARDVRVDDGLSPITADDYVRFRLQPAKAKLMRQSPRLDWALNMLTTVVFIFTALNASLAVLDKTELMPLVLSLISSVTATVDFESLRQRIANVNGTLATIGNAEVWWESLSFVDKRLDMKKEQLVDYVEGAIVAEMNWAATSNKKLKKSKTGKHKSTPQSMSPHKKNAAHDDENKDESTTQSE